MQHISNVNVVFVRLPYNMVRIRDILVRLRSNPVRIPYFTIFLMEIIAFPSKLLSMCFSVKEVKEVIDEEVVQYPVTLSCAPLEKVAGWKLEEEDPIYYSEDVLWHGARREWPSIPLPGGKGPVPAGATGGEGSSASAAPAPAMSSHLKEMLDMHADLTRMIMKLGGDPIKHFQESQMDLVLQQIKSTDLDCKVCGKHYSTTSRMRNHFKARHLKKTDYQCQTCKRYYTDAGTLGIHMAVHDTSKNPSKCHYCPKTFSSDAKMKQHLPVHQAAKFICQFVNCGRLFKWQKGKVDHEGSCALNPDAPSDPPFQCGVCAKGYWSKRSLDRHTKEKH